MRALVTGAGGFVGAHLVQRLVQDGYEVAAWVRPGSAGHAWRLASLLTPNELKAVTIDRVDLIDRQSVAEGLERAAARQVYHLAAQAHVGEAWKRPQDTVLSNVLGTTNLLEAARQTVSGYDKIVVAGSSEEYGGVTGEGENAERSPLEPRSLYAATKVCQDVLGMTYWRAFDLPVVVARSNNIYGPGQGVRYLTGTIITQALSRDLVRLGNPDSARDFTYVTDAADAYVRIGRSGRPGQTYTWGQGRSWTVAKWVELSLKAVERVNQGEDDWKIEYDVSRRRPGKSEVDDLVAAPEKIGEELGWMPHVAPAEGLYLTAQWYHNHRSFWVGDTDWR